MLNYPYLLIINKRSIRIFEESKVLFQCNNIYISSFKTS